MCGRLSSAVFLSVKLAQPGMRPRQIGALSSSVLLGLHLATKGIVRDYSLQEPHCLDETWSQQLPREQLPPVGNKSALQPGSS